MNYIDSRRVWGILVNHAGAGDTDSNWVSFRQWFDKAFEKGADEYRFIGSLGFGGKFWLHHTDGMRVSCYREDETPERLAAIEATNHALAIVWGWQVNAAANVGGGTPVGRPCGGTETTLSAVPGAERTP